MENLYRIKEYSGKLPNPKSFPIGGAIVAIKDKPYAFCDGFMLDLSVREADKEVLEERASRIVDNSSINTLLEEAVISGLLLSESEFIYNTTYPSYIMFTPKGNPVAIQVKYYRYFKNRYKDCKFYKRDEDTTIIAIKVGEEVVGLCMPIFLDRLSLEQIREEGK